MLSLNFVYSEDMWRTINAKPNVKSDQKLHLDRIFITIFFLTIQTTFSHCLSCYDCTYVWDSGDDVTGFDRYCATKLIRGNGSGYAGCVRIIGSTDIKGQILVIRGGFYNKLPEGRALSCYNESSDFKYDPHLSDLLVATIRSCSICDADDGCNFARANNFDSHGRLIIICVILSTVFSIRGLSYPWLQ